MLHTIKSKIYLFFQSIRLDFGDTKSSFALQATPEEVPEPVVEVQVNKGENSLALALLLSQGSGIIVGAQKLNVISDKRERMGAEEVAERAPNSLRTAWEY